VSDELAKEQAMILVDRAFRHQLKGELADAIILYERSLSLWPTAEAHTYIGWTYSMMARYDEAIASCQKAIEIDQFDVESYVLLGDIYEKSGMATRSQRMYQQAFELDPANEAAQEKVQGKKNSPLDSLKTMFGRNKGSDQGS